MPELYQYYVTSRTGTRQVYPYGKPKINYSKTTEDYRFGYTIKPDGDYTFIGEDFDWFYNLEKSGYRCEFILFSIWKYCSGAYIEDWQVGKISLNNGEWDLDRCSVTFKIDTEDKYACYENNKDGKLNLLLSVTGSDKDIVHIVAGEVEYYNCTITYGSDGAIEDPSPCPPPSGDNWLPYYSKVTYNFSGDPGRIEELKFARINNGDGTYSKPVLYNERNTSTADASGQVFETTYDIAGIDGATDIDNGMKLKACVEALVFHFCPQITLVKSDFFQWNPDVATTTNYVTGQPSKVLNLFLFQKTDIRNPNAQANATIAEISFEEMITFLCIIFNLRWDIIGTTFRIEHLSWWNKSQGLDLTQPRYSKYIFHKNKYSYANDKLTKYERFTWMESLNVDFTGVDISYDSACVPQGITDDNITLYEVKRITTDIGFVMSHPDIANDDTIDNDGFCLVACNSDNNILYENGILTPAPTLNNTLGWAQLQRDYHKYGRMALDGRMNREQTHFETSIPTKKQVTLSVPLCCGDEFNPEDLITTQLGTGGNVDSATFDLTSEVLEVDLLFDPNVDLEINEPPLANEDSATTFMNMAIDIDVLANDTDADGTIDPDSIVIVFGGSHGTTTVNPDGTLHYVPNEDFVGEDTIEYSIKDNWGEESIPGVVHITVEAAADAVNDNFVTFTNEELTGSLLGNDSGPGIIVTAFDSTSVHGGTVDVEEDGSFTYTPAEDYFGSDSFTYTITDSNGNTSTATVNITVNAEREMVYVKLVQTLISTEPTNSCDPPIPEARQEKSNVEIFYYADSAGTIPMDISGYGLTINVRNHSVNSHDSSSSDIDYTYTTGTGVSHLFRDNVVTHLTLINCDGSYGGTDYDDTYSLLPGTGYTVI